MKPASIAPKKPAPIWLAISAPTMPGAMPGRPAME